VHSSQNFEAYVIEHYDWDMFEPEGDDDERPAEGSAEHNDPKNPEESDAAQGG